MGDDPKAFNSWDMLVYGIPLIRILGCIIALTGLNKNNVCLTVVGMTISLVAGIIYITTICATPLCNIFGDITAWIGVLEIARIEIVGFHVNLVLIGVIYSLVTSIAFAIIYWVPLLLHNIDY